MFYYVNTEKFDGWMTIYTENARLVSAPNEEEAIKIYKSVMKSNIGRKKVHVREVHIPYGFIGSITIDGKQIPDKSAMQRR